MIIDFNESGGFPDVSTSDIYSMAEEKIRRFENLSPGWNAGSGLSIERRILDKGIELNKEMSLNGYLETDAFPGPDGSVMLTLYNKGDYLEFTIDPDETITFVHESNEQEVEYKEGLTLIVAKEKITEYRTQKWNSLDSSTRSSMIQPVRDLLAKPFSHQPPMMGSLSWQENASSNPIEPVATT